VTLSFCWPPNHAVPAVGYFSPIGGSADPETGTLPLDRHLRLVHDAFQLRSDVRSMIGVPHDEAVKLVTSGRRPELIDRIYAAYAAYKDAHDIVIVQGTSLGTGKLDAEIAGALNAPAIIACQVGEGTSCGHDISAGQLWQVWLAGEEADSWLAID